MSAKSWVFILLGMTWSCSPASTPKDRSLESRTVDPQNVMATALSTESEGEAMATHPAASTPMQRPPKVPRDRIDDRDFVVLRLAIGKQLLLDAESPVVSYKRPLQADYVEILRCKTQVIIDAGLHSISLQDVDVMSMSEADKDALFRSSNFFDTAARQEECELISTGTKEESYVDAWSPTGKFRWLVRACVSPERLSDADHLSTRNCSRRVAISAAVEHVNQRKDKENVYLQKSNYYSVQMDQIARMMQWKAMDFNEALDRCEAQEHRQAINRKKKEAIVTLVAAGLEVSIELRTAMRSSMAAGKDGRSMGFLQHYAKGGFQGKMDFLQILGALGGIMTSPMLLALVSASGDIPRSCDRALRLEQELGKAGEDLLDQTAMYGHFMRLAEYANMGQAAAAGDDVQVPALQTNGGGALGGLGGG